MSNFPIQKSNRSRTEPDSVPPEMYMAAYEVYSHVYGPQQALIENGCRGGFDHGELAVFLYARSLPREQWSSVVYKMIRKVEL